MRTSNLLRVLSILSLLFCATAGFGQTPPPTPVPLITQVTPPSLSPASLAPGSNSFTLTILGANFAPGDLVELSANGWSPTPTAIAFNPTVNATGTQMVANFTNVSLPVPGTLTVKVTKRDMTGAPLLASNPYYLPVTPSEQTAILEPAVTSFLPGSPSGMAVADFNGDGVPDLAVISQGPSGTNAVSILIGNFGGFTAGASYATGNAPSGIVAADFNGDHVVDLAVTNAMDNTVMIFLGNGDGTFRLGTTVSDPGMYPTQIVAADFNGDGHVDLAVLNACGTGQNGCYPAAEPLGPENVAILLGNGDGTFNVAPTMPATGFVSAAIAAADLNQDGFIDLIVANSSNNLTLLMGNGDGTFTAASSTPSTGFFGPPKGIAVGDFNGDGAPDVAVSSSGDDGVFILLNQNCAGLPAPQCTLTPKGTGIGLGTGTSPSAIATADMNADGLLDLVVANSGTGTVSILLGDGTGNFNPLPWPNQSFATGNSPQALVLTDVNMDGRLDVVTLNQSSSYSVLRQAAVMQLQLTTNNAALVYGYIPTLTVQLTPPPGAPAGPTGLISLLDGSTPITTTTLSGYQYQIQFVLPQGYFIGAGTHQLTAVYNGDTNFAPATSNVVTETVAISATTTTLSSNVINPPYGMSVTLTASIQPQVPAPATGTVTFTDSTNSTTLGTATVSNNSARLSLTNFGVGTHAIVATYSGDSNCTGSSSASVTETIAKAPTATAISATSMSSSLGLSVTFTATITPTPNNLATGSVLFLDSGTPIGSGTVSYNSAHFTSSTLGVGTHNITAQYSGDANFTGSTSTVLTETVNPGTATIYLALFEVGTTYGQNAGLVTVVQGGPSLPTPTGTLTFMDGSTALGTASLVNGSAQFTLPILTVGSHSISAQYSGDANYLAGTSNASTETVTVATTTTSLSANLTSAFYGQPVTFTATIQPQYGGAATGPVYLYDGAQVVGATTPSNNSAVFVVSSLAAGSHSLSAFYNGDKNTYASGSGGSPVALTVNPDATTTTLTSSPNPSNYGQTIVLTFNVQPAYGTLSGLIGHASFFDGSTLITTISFVGSGTQIGVSLGAGTHSITAQYLGTGNYLASTSAPVTQTINQTQSTTTLTITPNPTTYGQAVTATASLSSPSGFNGTGSVTLYDGSTSVGTASIIFPATTASFSLPSLTAGTHSLTAKYSGDANYLGSTSSAATETVNQASSTASVSSSVNPVTFGQSLTLTATVTPGASGSPTGTFTFFDGTTSLGTATIANNTAQLSASTLGAGSHSITAKYSGDANYVASTSSAFMQTVNQATTTTMLASSPNPSVYGQAASLTATVQPPSGVSATGTVTFFDGTNSLGSATVTGNTAQLAIASLGAGTRSLTASYNGNGNLLASTSAAVSQVVNPASTTTTISSSANPVSVGQAVTFTVSVQPAFGGTASGSVSFYDGSVLLGNVSLANNSGQLSVSTLGAGSHAITAAYNGDASTTASTSSILSQTINQATTTTAVTASPSPSVFNQWISFVVTVSPATGGTPTGTVTLMDGTNTLNTATLSAGVGRISYSGLAPGTHSITAVYSGDTNFTASTSATQSVTVNPASTTTTVSSSLNPSTNGQAVTFTAGVQAPQGISPSGAVTFMDGSTALGSASLSNGSAQLTLSGLAAGSHSITAVYGGDTHLAGSTSAALSQSVSTASSVTTVSSSANPATFGQAVVLSASIQAAFGGSATGMVTFLDGTTALGTAPVSGNAAQLSVSSLAVGSHSITAKYNGDANVAGSTSATLTETIAQATTAATVTSDTNPASFGQTVTFSVKIQSSSSGTLTGTVTLLDGSNSLGSSSLPAGGVAQFAMSGLAVGSHSISATYGGDPNFAGSTSAALTETVNQLATTTTVASSLNPATFGQAVTLTATVQAGSGISVAGTVTFLDGSLGLGTVTLANNSAQLTTSTLAPGAHTITAVYGSNGNFAGSTSAALTETVNQLTTTTTLASTANPALAGQSVTFTATVQAGAGNSPVGTITFLDGSTTLGSAAVTNNSAQLTISTLAPGSHSITAAYGGSTDFAASTSSALRQTVNQSSTTTTLVSNLNPATFGQAVPFVATVQTASGGAATGTVTFFDGATALGTASVSNSGGHNVAQLTFSGLLGGTHSITASYGGDANYVASTSSALTETVNAASSTVTLGASANPASFGQAVILTATVVPSVSGTPATGTVTFFDGASSLGTANLSNNVAQISVANFGLSSHSITATYAGDRNFAGSTSAALSETVNPAATSTVVTSKANPAVVKSNVTFTATVSSSSAGTQSGTVNFYLDGSSTSAATVNLSNGMAQYSTNSLSAGSHSVVAVFTSSNPNFAGSTSAAFTQFISDFTVAESPSSLTVARSTSGTYTLTVTPVGEFSGTVSLSCSGAPGGTTCAIAPTQVTLSGSASVQATVTITAGQNASKGTHTLTFTGTSGGLNHKITASLTID